MMPECPICGAILQDPDIAGRPTLQDHLDWHLTVDGGANRPVPELLLRTAQASTVAIVLNGSATVAITWETPMPSADYALSVALSPALIGRVTKEVVEKTATGIKVKLTAGGLAVAASTLQATAGVLVQPEED